MDEIKKAAALIGRKGGQASTPAKAEAARENGKKGGRPKAYRWITLDTVSGVVEWPEGLPEEAVAVSPVDLPRLLKECPDGVMYGCRVDLGTYRKIDREYGIK